MPCNDGRTTTDLELYVNSQQRLHALTALFCATLADIEGQGLMNKVRGDAQAWWVRHKRDDEKRKTYEREADLHTRFMMLSVKEQEDLLNRKP